MSDPQPFTVERKVTLMFFWAIASTIVLNICGAVWWTASADNRIKQLEKTDYSMVVQRLVAVEVKIDQAAENFGYNRQALDELNRKIDKMQDTRRK